MILQKILDGRVVDDIGENRRDDLIISVERAFALVEWLSDKPAGANLSEIARVLHVNKAIAAKLLDTLVALSYIWRDEIAQTFHLTFRVSNISLRQLQHSRMLDQCSPAIRSLAEQTGELVRLAVVERGEHLTWVLAAAGKRRTIQIDPNYGLEISLHTHATGKAWLSTLADEKVAALLGDRPLKEFTVRSITNPGMVMRDLAKTREEGYAVSYEENEPGVAAIAVPITITALDGRQLCVGTISLAAPTSRMSRGELVALVPAVQTVALNLAQMWPLHLIDESGILSESIVK
jgi:DNA-binding IclR family transcriptional regulator